MIHREFSTSRDTPELIANHGIQHVKVQQTHFISIGNFPDEEARAAGLRAMYPLSSGSSHVHYAPARFNESPPQPSESPQGDPPFHGSRFQIAGRPCRPGSGDFPVSLPVSLKLKLCQEQMTTEFTFAQKFGNPRGLATNYISPTFKEKKWLLYRLF
jgi:hypothetical protein